MKKCDLFQISILAVAMACAPYTAKADVASVEPRALPHLEAKDLRQYPSFVQITGDALGGAPGVGFTLRCGYAMDGNKMILDPSTDDLLMTSESSNAYTRFQFIDNKPFVSTLDPQGRLRPGQGTLPILFEAVEADNSLKSKSCSLTVENDTPSNCSAAQAFISADQAKASITALAKECSEFMAHAAPQIQAEGFDAAKTADWKSKLHQTISLVEQ